MESTEILAYTIIGKWDNHKKYIMNPEDSTIQGERIAVNLALSILNAHFHMRKDYISATINELYFHELNALRRSHTDSNPEFFKSKCNTLTSIRLALSKLY